MTSLNAKYHDDNLNTIRLALATDQNAYEANCFAWDAIMAAAGDDADLAAKMVEALPHDWPETPEEVDENVEALCAAMGCEARWLSVNPGTFLR